jgi:hypothetical protein
VPGDSITIVTPSYAGDFELCATLNRSVLQFFPAGVRHDIIVDGCDAARFRTLAGPRTRIITCEEILPRGYVKIPGTRRWFSTGAVVPVHGWLIQQIVKIAAVLAADTPVAVMADSDVVLVKTADPNLFHADDKTRLYRQSFGISSEMKAHVEWYRNACSLLHVTASEPPVHDYIGNLISWDRTIVQKLCKYIEDVSGRRWDRALVRTRRISEYLLYGIFVERVLGADAPVWIDERERCHNHWSFSPIVESGIADFVGSMGDDDISIMITSHSTTTPQVREAIRLETMSRQAFVRS